MAGNTFGQLFRITTFGESHGKAVGCIIDGCPAGIKITESDIQKDLDRRKPGQSKITTQRKESEKVEILSGVFEGLTTGTSIAMVVYNENQQSEDYEYIKDKYRPSHADYTYQQKYGIRDYRGGGRSSARETVARVMAGSLAKKILREEFGVEILAFVNRVKDIETKIDLNGVSFEQIESNIVRCPDIEISKKMEELILQTKKDGDSVGGEVTCVAKNSPVGLGEPVFDKLDAELARALLSIPATKGFEIGSGFGGTYQNGSEHNDEFYIENNKVKTKTNNSGGIQGGISNGEDIVIKLGFKPTATIDTPQHTINNKNEEIDLENIKGRHDPCVVPRAIPIVESMVAITLLDHILRQRGQNGSVS